MRLRPGDKVVIRGNVSATSRRCHDLSLYQNSRGEVVGVESYFRVRIKLQHGREVTVNVDDLWRT